MILLIFSSVRVSICGCLEEISERAFQFHVAGVSIKAKFLIEILLTAQLSNTVSSKCGSSELLQ